MKAHSKIRLILGYCLLLVLFSSCRPKGVLSRSEMAKVLFDVHLTEAAVSGLNEPVPEEWMKGMDPTDFKDMAYRAVLRKHHLTQEDFYFSVSWYSKHMKQYERVYLDVQKRMDNFETAVNAGLYSKNQIKFEFGLDSIKVSTLYSFGLHRPDTLLLHDLYTTADSIPSYSHWYTRQWMYAFQGDTSRLNLFPELSIHSVFNTSDPDSLKVIADSLLRQQTIPETSNHWNENPMPGARRIPPKGLREVPKNEQIRKRFQPRAVEQEQLKRMEAEQLRKEKIEAAKQQEVNHWK